MFHTTDGGKSWTRKDFGSNVALHAIAGSASDKVFVVGADGVVLRFDGSDWTMEDAGTTLYGVWAGGDTVLAVGNGMVLRRL